MNDRSSVYALSCPSLNLTALLCTSLLDKGSTKRDPLKRVRDDIHGSFLSTASISEIAIVIFSKRLPRIAQQMRINNTYLPARASSDSDSPQ